MSGRWMRAGVAVLLAIGASSCNRKPAAVALAPAAPIYQVELKPLTPLNENRATHIVVDTLGNVCWVQETQRGDDLMFVIGEGNIPGPTQLSSRRICEALGYADGDGNIQGLAPGRNADVYFYFQGSRGHSLLACLGIYSPKTARLRVLADTEALMKAGDMGRSLALARGTLVANGPNLWLWLRHTDASVLFRVPHAEIPASGPLALETRMVNVRRGGKTVDLTDEDHQISAGEGDSLLWLDVPGRMLRTIDASGNVTDIQSLIGLPLALSAPAPGEKGKIVMFAGDSPLLEANAQEQVGAGAGNLRVLYPAMLILEGKEITGIGRDSFSVYSGFALSQMRLKRLAPEPHGQSWVAYDSNSGELLRLSITQRSEAY